MNSCTDVMKSICRILFKSTGFIQPFEIIFLWLFRCKYILSPDFFQKKQSFAPTFES